NAPRGSAVIGGGLPQANTRGDRRQDSHAPSTVRRAPTDARAELRASEVLVSGAAAATSTTADGGRVDWRSTGGPGAVAVGGGGGVPAPRAPAARPAPRPGGRHARAAARDPNKRRGPG